MQQIDCQVDIEDFCAEVDLYELKDDEGEFVAQNIIEKAFSRIKTKVGTVIAMIKAKSQNEKCFGCHSVDDPISCRPFDLSLCR